MVSRALVLREGSEGYKGFALGEKINNTGLVVRYQWGGPNTQEMPSISLGRNSRRKDL